MCYLFKFQSWHYVWKLILKFRESDEGTSDFTLYDGFNSNGHRISLGLPKKCKGSSGHCGGLDQMENKLYQSEEAKMFYNILNKETVKYIPDETDLIFLGKLMNNTGDIEDLKNKLDDPNTTYDDIKDQVPNMPKLVQYLQWWIMVNKYYRKCKYYEKLNLDEDLDKFLFYENNYLF